MSDFKRFRKSLNRFFVFSYKLITDIYITQSFFVTLQYYKISNYGKETSSFA